MAGGNEPALRGAAVMVTRPPGQEQELCRLIEGAGGRVVRFPTLHAVSLGEALIRERLARVDDDFVVFISPNAVRMAFGACPGLAGKLAGARVCAAGAGTERALAQHGVAAHSGVSAKAGSEGLLELPELLAEKVHGRSVLIVRGEGGRELLYDELERRGARPRYVEVYRREAPAVDGAAVRKIWQEDRPDVIVITSIQGLDNLLLMTPRTYHSHLFRTRVAAISPRVGRHAENAGFRAAVAVAAAATDAALLEAAARALKAET